MKLATPSTTYLGTAAPQGTLIKVHETTAPGDSVDAGDTAVDGTEGYTTNPPLDEIVLQCVNNHTGSLDLCIQLGGDDTDHLIVETVASKGGMREVLRARVARGTTVKVWCATADKLFVLYQKDPFRG